MTLDAARVAAAVVAFIVTMAACSSSTPDPSEPGNDAAIEQQLDLAQTSNAAPEQIEQLEIALDQGEVTTEQLIDLNSRVMECLTSAGFTVRDTGMEEILKGSGIELPGYIATQPEDLDDIGAAAVMDECGRRYMEFLQSAFMSQPSTDARYYDAFDTPAIRACLEEHGFDVDDLATGREIANLVYEDEDQNMALPDFRPCVPGIE